MQKRGLNLWHRKDVLAPTPSVRQLLVETSDKSDFRGFGGAKVTPKWSFVDPQRDSKVTLFLGGNKESLVRSLLGSAKSQLLSREKLYTAPPPPPIFGQTAFLRGMGGVYILKPPAAGLYTPPLFYNPPPNPRRLFSEVGGCTKCGPPFQSNFDYCRDQITADPEKCLQELISEKLLISLRGRPCLEFVIVSSNSQACSFFRTNYWNQSENDEFQ